MAGQIAVLKSYAADSSPMADLASLATRKAAQQQGCDQQLTDLKALLAGGNPDSSPSDRSRQRHRATPGAVGRRSARA